MRSFVRPSDSPRRHASIVAIPDSYSRNSCSAPPLACLSHVTRKTRHDARTMVLTSPPSVSTPIAHSARGHTVPQSKRPSTALHAGHADTVTRSMRSCYRLRKEKKSSTATAAMNARVDRCWRPVGLVAHPPVFVPPFRRPPCDGHPTHVAVAGARALSFLSSPTLPSLGVLLPSRSALPQTQISRRRSGNERHSPGPPCPQGPALHRYNRSLWE